MRRVRRTIAGRILEILLVSTTCFMGECKDSGEKTSNSDSIQGSGIKSQNISDNAGQAVWVRSTISALSISVFNGVTTDSSGNIFAVGNQVGSGTHSYSALVTSAGAYSGSNAVIVKYDNNGAAQWARTVSIAPDDSVFLAVAADSSGNIYAAGYQNSTGTFTYGAGVTSAGSHTFGNAILVKYNSAGIAQWAKTVSTGTGNSRFYSIAIDGADNIFLAGSQASTSIFTYAVGITAQGPYNGDNAMIVKYDTAGNAQWVKTLTSASHSSTFNTIALDGLGNIYAGGQQGDNGTFAYGAGITATGSYSFGNAVLVKYNSNGSAIWARTVSTGNDASHFKAIRADSSGNIYATGYQKGNSTFTYATGVSAMGTTANETYTVLVKYNDSGVAQWVKSVTGGTSTTANALSVDALGNIFVAGWQFGTATYLFGNGVSSAAAHTGMNIMLVKYSSGGIAQWARTVTTGAGISQYFAIRSDASGQLYTVGEHAGSSGLTYGAGATETPANSSGSIVIVQYK